MSKSYGVFPDQYELIDAGNSCKLERWGDIITIRPELQAYFTPAQSLAEWRKQAHWEFIPDSPASLNGRWKALRPNAPVSWLFTTSASMQVQLETAGNKHIGLFPEQEINWRFIREQLDPGKRFLNLFAYTGAASLAGRMTGAEVTHVDSVRAMIDKARINMEATGLSDIRWVVEDARKFVQREIKRGNRYDLVQMDPPAWGLGTKGEKWKLENLLPDLIAEGMQILQPGGTLIVNTYSPKIELKNLRSLLQELDLHRQSETQELWLKTTTGKSLFYGLIARIKK